MNYQPDVSTEPGADPTAEMLSGMMDSPVITVPSLADVPDDAVAGLYAFTNGVRPDDTPTGPFGFQPDVFDSVPGDDAYRPLRRLIRVSWAEENAPRVLTSVGEIREAEQAGEVTVEETSVVINAPMLSWPGGSR